MKTYIHMERKKRCFWTISLLSLIMVFGILMYTRRNSMQIVYKSHGNIDVWMWFYSSQNNSNSRPTLTAFKTTTQVPLRFETVAIATATTTSITKAALENQSSKNPKIASTKDVQRTPSSLKLSTHTTSPSLSVKNTTSKLSLALSSQQSPSVSLSSKTTQSVHKTSEVVSTTGKIFSTSPASILPTKKPEVVLSTRKSSNSTSAFMSTSPHLVSSTLQIVSSSTTKSPLSSTISSTTSPKRNTFYACPVYTGRIGNLMFQFASTYGIVAGKNMTVMIEESNVLNNMFTLTVEKRKDISFCHKLAMRGEKQHCGYDPNLSNFQPTQDYRFGIYLQSWKYFVNVSQDIRKQFTFKPDVRAKSELVINKLFEKRNIKSRSDVILIGIHIRRGDFVDNKYGYTVATKEYLHRAIKYFTDRFINVLFIVCTNDLKWTKDNIPPVSVEYTENNQPEVDMCILSLCDNTIITVGTFGWWAAWLNNGTTIYFKWPAKEGSPLRKDFSADYMDFFPPTWIGL